MPKSIAFHQQMMKIIVLLPDHYFRKVFISSSNLQRMFTRKKLENKIKYSKKRKDLDDFQPISAISPNSQKLLKSPRKAIRKIPKSPFKVLDAPDLQDDFYLNLVDWSSTNVLSVGLGSCVYLWSAHTSQVRNNNSKVSIVISLNSGY